MISEGVYARYLHGAMGDEIDVDFAAFKEGTETLAERALWSRSKELAADAAIHDGAALPTVADEGIDRSSATPGVASLRPEVT